MRVARLASWIALCGGLASLVYAGLQGDLDVYLLLVVPVVTGTGPWAGLGLLAAFAGLAGLLWTSATRYTLGGPAPRSRDLEGRRGEPGGDARRQEGSEGTSTRGGGVILVGPIPIVWGSDRSTTRWLIVAGIALTVAAIVLTLLLET